MDKKIGQVLAGIAIVLAGAGVAIINRKKRVDILELEEPTIDIDEDVEEA